MAAKIELVRGATVISLQGGGDDIWLREDGWVRTVARRGDNGQWPESVPETLTCLVQADDDDDLALIIQGVNEILRQGSDFVEDSADDNPVYLRVQLTNESNDYQALVLNGRAEPANTFYNWPVETDNLLPVMVIEITRVPFWEPNAIVQTITLTSMNSYGTLFNYGAGTTIAGDVPARVAEVTVDGAAHSGFSEFWLGWRTNRLGDRTNFEPVWSLDDANTLSNNTAIAGSIIRWTPGGGADNLLLQRAIISIEDVLASDFADMRGRFLVLIRALASSTRTFRVKMSAGLMLGNQWDSRPRVLIDSNSYYWYSLGEIVFPLAGRLLDERNVLHREDAGHRLQALRIEAEVATDGAGTLDMDRLFLVPLSEGMLHVKGGQSISAGSEALVHAVEPDNSDVAELWRLRSSPAPASLAIDDYPVYDTRIWSLPPGAGSGAFVGQDLTVSRTSDVFTVGVRYQERWLTLGGAG